MKINLPSERKILRVLTVITALFLYGGIFATLIFITLFFDWLPVPNKILLLAVASICLLSFKYILNHLKELTSEN